MDYLFNGAMLSSTLTPLTTSSSATDGANSAGFSYVRVPLGASDFSADGKALSCSTGDQRTDFQRTLAYSFAETSGDTSLNDFDINAAPSAIFTVLQDILSINHMARVHILPWSPVCTSFDPCINVSVPSISLVG